MRPALRRAPLLRALLAPTAALAAAAACRDATTAPSRTAAVGAVSRALGVAAGGTYYLHNACGGRVLDVTGASTSAGARVLLWDKWGGANQRWTLAPVGDGSYTLTSANTGMVLDVFGAGRADGTAVGQWPANGGANQHWRVTDLGNGYAKLRPTHDTTKALDAAGAGTANGTPVQIWGDNGTCAQQWQLEAVPGDTAPTPAPSAHVRTVGPGEQYATLTAAVAAAQAGDTIRVDAGTYTNDFPGLIRDLTVEGVGGLAHFVATQNAPNRKAILDVAGAVTLRRLELSGATVADADGANGAGVRYEGGTLMIEDSYVHDNQNGLLAARDTAGTVRITRSEFAYNGVHNGAYNTHNIYVGDVRQFTFDRSYSHDALVGHEIKSRAENTAVTNSRIYDLADSAGYTINVPNGGNLTVTGSVIQQGPNSPNRAILSYADEGGSNTATGAAHAGTQVTVSGNTILNERAGGATGIYVPAGAAISLTFANNALWSVSSSDPVGEFLAGLAGTASGNTALPAEPALDTSHPFVLGAASAARARAR